jgi:hypothetical protein
MKHEIIYTEHYALIVSDEKVVEGDTLFCTEIKNLMIGGITSEQLRYLDSEIFKKVIAHRPLTDAPILEGVPLIPPFSRCQEDGAENAVSEFKKTYGSLGAADYELSAFSKGYNKAKETYKYTEEDLRKAFLEGNKYPQESKLLPDFYLGNFYNRFIQSLQQPKRPKYFEYEMARITKFNGEPDYFEPNSKPNPQGQTELVGEYIYE